MAEGAEQSLSEDEKDQLFALLLEYHMLFARGDDDLGCTAEVQHRIDTGPAVCAPHATIAPPGGQES